MTNRGVGVVGVRLLAIYILLRLLFLLPQMVTHWNDPAQPNAPIIVVMVAALLIAAYMWFRVGTVVGWLLPARTAESLATGDSPGDRMPMALAFAAAGALLLAWSLPELVAEALSFYGSHGPMMLTAEPEALTGIAVSGLRVLLGVGLMLGGGGVMRVIYHLRRTGAA